MRVSDLTAARLARRQPHKPVAAQARKASRTTGLPGAAAAVRLNGRAAARREAHHSFRCAESVPRSTGSRRFSTHALEALCRPVVRGRRAPARWVCGAVGVMPPVACRPAAGQAGEAETLRRQAAARATRRARSTAIRRPEARQKERHTPCRLSCLCCARAATQARGLDEYSRRVSVAPTWGTCMDIPVFLYSGCILVEKEVFLGAFRAGENARPA